jgi:hypothetical protein
MTAAAHADAGVFAQAAIAFVPSRSLAPSLISEVRCIQTCKDARCG